MEYSNAPQGASVYPDHPGFKGNSETGREAANAVAKMARNYRDQILAAFNSAYPEGRSADQIAEAMGLSRYSVRPRVSELAAGGKLEKTEGRTKNDAGMTVLVWRAAR